MEIAEKVSGWKLMLILLALLSVLTAACIGGVLLVLAHRVRGEYFDSNDVSIHYTHYTVEGEGEPLVLLHGFAVNADLNWRLSGLTKELAKKYMVISLDLRGHGLSGKPHDANAYGDEMVEGIPELAISEEQVLSIPLPVCGIVGERDPMRISAMAMEGRVPHLRLVVIDGADHITTPMKKETLDVLLSCLEHRDQ